MSNLVYVVTSYGKVMGCYADPKDAFDAQMLAISKGRISELVACEVKPSNNKLNGK